MNQALATATTPERTSLVRPAHKPSVAARKLDLFQRSGLFGSDLKGCTIERAHTAEDLRQAYQLVHDIYLSSGFITPDQTGMRVRIFEMTPDTSTFVAKFNGKVVGVLSVVEDSPELGLPSDGVFNEEMTELRGRNRRVCEMTNQAVSEEFRKSAVPSELMRCAFAVSLTGKYNEVAAVISPSHLGFYELLGFRQIGVQRSYSTKIEDPVIAVSANIDCFDMPKCELDEIGQFFRDFFQDGNEYLAKMTRWTRLARQSFLTPDLLKELFVIEGNFLARCTPSELEIVHDLWGSTIFNAVTADTFKFGPAKKTATIESFAARLGALIQSKLFSQSPFPAYAQDLTPIPHG